MLNTCRTIRMLLMFFETNYNSHKFRDQYPLPLVVQGINMHYTQEPVNRPAGFGCHQLVLVTKGTGRFTVNGEVRTLAAGQCCFMRRDIAHAYLAAGDTFETAWFSFFGCDALMELYHFGTHFWWDVTTAFVRRFEEFYRLCCHNSTPVSRSAAGFSLLCDLLHARFSPAAPLAQRVDELLENHFHRDLSLDEIAAQAGVSKYTLCHRYREATGVSVMEQLRRIRIAKAKQYLTATAHSVAHIGELCGFRDASYFTKTFREATGLSPSVWRQKG